MCVYTCTLVFYLLHKFFFFFFFFFLGQMVSVQRLVTWLQLLHSVQFCDNHLQEQLSNVCKVFTGIQLTLCSKVV